jgi:hypothetical protein
MKKETKRERKGKTGQLSTSEPVLKYIFTIDKHTHTHVFFATIDNCFNECVSHNRSMQHQHKLPGLVLQFRHIQKTLSTWLEALDKKQINGRIHTTFVQTGTATGRLSSRDPVIQALSIFHCVPRLAIIVFFVILEHKKQRFFSITKIVSESSEFTTRTTNVSSCTWK